MKRSGSPQNEDEGEEFMEEHMVFTQAVPSPKPIVPKASSGKAIRVAGQKVSRAKKKRKMYIPGDFLILIIEELG